MNYVLKEGEAERLKELTSRCSKCGRKLHDWDEDWSLEDAIEECEQVFGQFDPNMVAPLCGQCYSLSLLMEAIGGVVGIDPDGPEGSPGLAN